MEILINNEQEHYDLEPYEDLLIKAFSIAAAIEDLPEDFEVSISFVDDRRIHELNLEYRGVDAPTDVLSFPQNGEDDLILPEGFPLVLGDIIISLERALEQARDFDHSLEREVIYLSIHGFFHLVGYDHETEAEQQVMRELEERVLGELDLGRD